jgi:hypothetical protein
MQEMQIMKIVKDTAIAKRKLATANKESTLLSSCDNVYPLGIPPEEINEL